MGARSSRSDSRKARSNTTSVRRKKTATGIATRRVSCDAAEGGRMIRITRSAAATGAVLLAGMANAAPPPVEAYAQRPAMIDVDINPAGTRLAWIEDTGTTARLIVHDLKAKKDLRSISAPSTLKLHAVYWANDDTVLMNESKTDSIGPNRRETFELQRWVALD